LADSYPHNPPPRTDPTEDVTITSAEEQHLFSGEPQEPNNPPPTLKAVTFPELDNRDINAPERQLPAIIPALV
jgi:hypothetical protein